MKNLPEKYSWLIPFRFILEANYAMDDFDLLKIIKMQKEVKESCPSKTIIDKLISDQEIRSALVESTEEPLSEHLLDFCHSHPSLDDFRSLPWHVINEEIQPEAAAMSTWTYEEKFLIKELWCCNPIRKKILDLKLSMILADDFEKENVMEEKDLKKIPFRKILNLCKKLTPFERDELKNWYRKSSKNTEQKKSEGETRSELQSKIERMKFLIEECTCVDAAAGDQIVDELNQHLKLLELNWERGEEHQDLIRVNKILTQVEDILKGMEQPYEKDEDLVANANNGLALHGLRFGIDSGNLCSPAPQPLLKTPAFCVIENSPISTKKSRFLFQEHLEGLKFKRLIIENGFCLNYQSEIGSNAETTNQESAVTMLDLYIYPMASYNIERTEIILLPSALESLRNVKDVMSADKFLEDYGSHVSCGANVLGAIVCQSVRVSTSQQLTQETAVVQSSDVKCSFDLDVCKIATKFPKLFEELLKANSRAWHIIERSEIPAKLLPIWNIVYEQHPNLKYEADLLRKAWLRKAEEVNIEIVSEERLKVEKSLASQTNDEKVKRLQAQLHELTQLNLDAIDESEFLSKLEAFFILIAKIENQPNSTGEENPWITFVAKQEKFCRLLKHLADNWEIYKSKFPNVFAYLTRTMNEDKLEMMNSSHCPLEENICQMLRQGASSLSQEQYNVRSRPVPDVAVENLVDLLSGELNYYDSHHRKYQVTILITSQTSLKVVLYLIFRENPIQTNSYLLLWSKRKSNQDSNSSCANFCVVKTTLLFFGMASRISF